MFSISIKYIFPCVGFRENDLCTPDLWHLFPQIASKRFFLLLCVIADLQDINVKPNKLGTAELDSAKHKCYSYVYFSCSYSPYITDVVHSFSFVFEFLRNWLLFFFQHELNDAKTVTFNSV